SPVCVYDRGVESTRPWTLSHRARRWFDAALVLGLLAVMLVFGISAASPVALGLCLLQTVPLWWRRSRPATVFAAVAGASALQVFRVGDPLPSQVAFPIAVYSAARWGRPGVPATTLVVTLLAAGVASWSWTHTYALGWSDYVGFFVTALAIAVSAWALGI